MNRVNVDTYPQGDNAKNWFMNYCKKLEQNEEEKQNILSSNEYMEWLCEFSLRYQTFNSQQFLYKNSKKVSVKDYRLVNCLNSLYSILEDYANNNYIIGSIYDGNICYFLEYKGIIFRIGKIIKDSDILFSCTRIKEIEDDIVLLRFDDIKEVKDKLYTSGMKSKLKELADYINNLRKMGISDNAIRETTERVLKLTIDVEKKDINSD